MTNRHVAELFALGLGARNLSFRSGQAAAWDYLRERSSPPPAESMLDVQQIVMIHPYWDMALLRVAGLSSRQAPLRLSVTPPEELVDREIAVIGYPAKDLRNDSDLQDFIFQRTYNVKRLQPGKVKIRRNVESFGRSVSAMTHDSSTLGGNSGSAMIDVHTGEVVGLHFAGRYLEANYAAPTYELARDPRVVDAGVNFIGRAAPDPALDAIWRNLEPAAIGRAPAPPLVPSRGSSVLRLELEGVSFSVPVQLDGARPAQAAATAPESLIEALKHPIVFPNLDDRRGFDRSFLELESGEVPLPALTEAGEKIVARLEDGDAELRYHKFSVVMHKKRRMALFTAANVDWRDQFRRINGSKPTRKELTGLGPNDSEKWFTDERIPQIHQLPDKFYTKDGGAFDKGHLVRRDDVCWGSSFQDIQKANGDTYHTTNCSPQTSGFNQSSRGVDNWGDLENLIQAETGAERVVLFSGPVLSKKDLRFEGFDERGVVQIQIPSAFWKIVLAQGDDGLEAFGFVLEQDLSDVPLEFAVPTPWKRYMRSIADIEKLLFGLVSLEWLKPFDQFEPPRARRFNNRASQ